MSLFKHILNTKFTDKENATATTKNESKVNTGTLKVAFLTNRKIAIRSARPIPNPDGPEH